jgi:hypothetical protein
MFFQPSPMFASKAGAYPSKAPLYGCIHFLRDLEVHKIFYNICNSQAFQSSF